MEIRCRAVAEGAWSSGGSRARLRESKPEVLVRALQRLTVLSVAGDVITLTHSFSNMNGNLDLNLHAPSQMNDVGKTGSYAAITFSFDDVETLTHTAAETGTYYILSFNNNETRNPYTLTIAVQ